LIDPGRVDTFPGTRGGVRNSRIDWGTMAGTGRKVPAKAPGPIRPIRPVGPIAPVGPRVVVGSTLLNDALARTDLSPEVKAQLLKSLGPLLPGSVTKPGTATADRTITPAEFQALVPGAAITAAGLDPLNTPVPAPPVLWHDGANALIVQLAKVQATLGNGYVDITVPVTCDQTGDAAITVTFVTGTPQQPAAGIVASEDRPRGPAAVVECWHEPLLAFCWHLLVVATSALSSAAGSDVAGDQLITAGIAVTTDGITVTPMGRHPFTAATAP
jgi:hypothetical protein